MAGDRSADIAAIALGVFAGLALVALIGRWLRFVNGLRQSALGKVQSQIRVLGIPLLALASPVPWLVFGALPYAAFYFVYLRQSHLAAVFFEALGAVVLSQLTLFIAMISVVLRRKRKALGK